MADFSESDDRQGFVAGSLSYTFDLSFESIRQPAVLHALLEQVLGFHDLGRFEKTAWECTFRHRGVRASIAHRKLGVHLYLDRTGYKSAADAKAAAADIRMAIRRALKAFEIGFLRDFAANRLKSGNVTVLNQSRRFREMYKYFTVPRCARLGPGSANRTTLG